MKVQTVKMESDSKQNQYQFYSTCLHPWSMTEIRKSGVTSYQMFKSMQIIS